jgi:outer-membrane receptor for ferric coprogen and ferric-rhodotorulic acid
MNKKTRLAWLLAGLIAGSVHAAEHDFDIAAQSLAGALSELARQGGIQLLFRSDELGGAKAPALRGHLEPEEALRHLLDDGDFTFVRTAPDSYAIQRRTATRLLPELVISAGNEGYKSDRITVAGKVPLSAREIPNSVSVVTRQQMDDENMVTVADALAMATGVTVIPNDATQSQYSARGYSLNVANDGMPAYSGLGGYQQFDLAIYERVEVLRGPAGLLQGSGDPGGVVNLVRKRAKSEYAFSGALSVGSWNNVRTELDVTGPLNEDKSLRGRAVLSMQDRDYFYSSAHDQKQLGYGILEYDLSSQTTVSLSATLQKDDGPAYYGGPAYSNGNFLNISRSTNLYPSWARTEWYTQEFTGEVEHHFDKQWVAKARVSTRHQDFYWKDAIPSSVNAATNTLNYSRRVGDFNYDRDAIDLYVNGPFELLGRTHNLLLGYNYDKLVTTGRKGSGTSVTGVTLGDLSQITEPYIAFSSGSESKTVQSGFYGQTRLSLSDPLTLVVGGRYSDFNASSHNMSPSTPTAWKQGARESDRLTPYGGLVYDVNKSLSLYASYADIFIPQTDRTYSGEVLKPRVGSQYEVGTKADLFDGKLSATLALFDIRDRNRSYEDPDHPDYYLAMGEVESKGWETEVSGKPAPTWDVVASYTRLDTKYLKDDDPAYQGQSLSNWYPHHTFKLWNKYRFTNPQLAGFSVGLGVIAMSGYAGNGSTSTLKQGGYALVNAQVGYRINRNYALDLSVYNLFDRTYHTAGARTLNSYNGYGEPRSMMLTMRVNY